MALWLPSPYSAVVPSNAPGYFYEINLDSVNSRPTQVTQAEHNSLDGQQQPQLFNPFGVTSSTPQFRNGVKVE